MASEAPVSPAQVTAPDDERFGELEMVTVRDGASRRSFLKGAAAVTAAGGTLALLDQLAGPITRAEAQAADPAFAEQSRVGGLEAITDNGVTVVIPPLYKYMITCKLKRDRTWSAKELQKAQAK